MNRPAILIGLFVVANVLAHLAIWRTVGEDSWGTVGKGLLLGFSLGQAALLVVWLVFGGGNVVMRIVTVLTALVLFAGLVSPTTRRTPWNEWLGVLCVYALALGTPLFLLQALGTRLLDQQGSAPHRPASPNQRLGAWQVSLSTILTWVTGFCVALGILRGCGFPWEYALQASIHCLGFAVVGLGSLWAALGRDMARPGWPWRPPARQSAGA